MKMLALIVLGTVVSCNSYQQPIADTEKAVTVTSDPLEYASTITEEELKTHLFVYASDDFQGRETGKPGQKKAVEYLKT